MNTKNDKQTILIIDGYHLLHKGYYGSLKRTKVAVNRDGVKINAIYTFISKINQIIDSGIYRTVIVTFDVDKGCWRRELYPEYKAKRKETPEDLIPQMKIIREFLTWANIPWYEKPNYEGDDVMGTIARIACNIGYNVHILSNDKDTYQLVNENTKIITKGSREDKISFIDSDIVKTKMGCNPCQVADIKSLMGDPSDNIKGVKYLRYQTAIALLDKYGSVENILANVDELPPHIKTKIIESKEQILTNKKITTIMKELKLGRIDFRPLRVNWNGYIKFLKKHKMWAYVNYAEKKREEFYKKLHGELEDKPTKSKVVKTKNKMPKSCNCEADVAIVGESDYFAKPEK